MRHLPNLLTLGNLFCGCLAIVYILQAQPYLYDSNPSEPGMSWSWVHGTPLLVYGGVFILIAAVFDLLDGWVARMLNIHSPIGKDLDSLADVVSFGVAPSLIIYKMLNDAVAHEPKVLNVDILMTAPAFLIACFAALRLAKFNSTPQQNGLFKGLPVPAVGVLIASFALIDWENPTVILKFIQNRWVLYGIIIFVCWLMVSKISFFKLMPKNFNLQSAWKQLLLIILFVLLFILFKWSAIPLIFIAYLLLSYFFPTSNETSIT